MDFRISDTFTDSLARLTGDEQKAVKTTVFDLQVDPARPGHSFHRLDGTRDKNFWSVRAGSDIRIIVHRSPGSFLLCYVDHHDAAYDWAARRKIEAHPRTGAAQIVEIRETVHEKEIVVPVYVQEERSPDPGPQVLDSVSADELLGYGVPADWVEDVRQADEDQLLSIAERLPAEAAEAVLDLATGGRPRVSEPVSDDPFEHPDAQRRFRVIENTEELERALAYPWDRWLVFLHPDQRRWVEHDFNGPARVAGSAGTGKTIVALHRAVHLAREHPDARVLLTTFTRTLSAGLRGRLRKLAGNEPRVIERIDVEALDTLALRLYRALLGPLELASEDDLRLALADAMAHSDDETFRTSFVRTEWQSVVDAWQIESLEAYRDVTRVGRRTRLAESHREVLWPVFERVRATLHESGKRTLSEAYTDLARQLESDGRSPYDFAIIDEAQDLSVSQLRFFAALAGDDGNGLFFAGDLGQRIFQAPFSWKALGVDVRGRSRTLRVNYRTSHQIRVRADRLLDSELADPDGHLEDRTETVSVFNGPPPTIATLATQESEATFVGEWLRARHQEGVAPGTMAVFVRSESEFARASSAVDEAGLESYRLEDCVRLESDRVAIGTMHLAKGLEFGTVAVMACDEDIIPLEARIQTIGDETDLHEVYHTERHLLYVACTRARDNLLVTGVEPGSEFLEDLTA